MDETAGKSLSNSLSGSVTGGPVIQARDIQIVALESGPVVPIPQQLRPPPDVFVNRLEIQDEMTAELARRHAAGRPALFSLYGPAGVGVGTAVQKWYWDNRKTFRDGVIRIPLGDMHGDPSATPLDAINDALVVLGVPPSELPSSPDRAADRMRTLTADRAVLLVIQNAIRADQVRPLVLNSPASAVVVTSRQPIDSLRAMDFRLWGIAPLDGSFSRELLRGVLRWNAGPLDDATEAALLKPCGGLPLVIRHVAAELTGTPSRRIERRLRKICELGVLGLRGETREEIAAIFDLAYDEMNPLRQRVYRHLALLPGDEFGAPVVAALLDLDRDEVEDELDGLLAAGLLTELPNDRFGLHETLRWHAEQRLLAEESATDRKSAILRMLTWYLRTAVGYDKALSNRWRVGSLYKVVPEYGEGRDPKEARAAALAWLETEQSALVRAVALADQEDFHDLCWQLCEALWGVFHTHRHYEAWIETHRIAIVAATTARNDLAVMRISSQLGSAYLDTGEFPSATECFTQSLAAARRIDHREGEQSALEWLGKVEARQRHVEPALDYWAQSWAVADSVPEPQRSRMFALIELHRGRLFESVGRFAAATEPLHRAGEYFGGTHETDNQAKVRLAVGKVLRGQGRIPDAVAELSEALRLFHEDGSTGGQVDVLLLLADLAREQSDADAEKRHLGAVLPLLVGLGDSRADAVRVRLAR